MPPIKRPSRYIKPEGYRTPHEIIKDTPDITISEANFTKKKGPFQEWKEISNKRYLNETNWDYNKLEDRRFHTHIIGSVKYPTIPSCCDIAVHLRYMKKIPVEHIMLIDPKTNKAIGYTSFAFTSKTEKIIDNIEEYYKTYKQNITDISIKNRFGTNNIGNIFKKRLIFEDVLIQELYPHKYYDNEQKNFAYSIVHPNKYIDILKNKFGIKIRFVPMPGYKFNPKKIMFEKEK
jgi:hypothetical protein